MSAGAEDILFWVPNSLEGCDGWGGGYYKASVVQWKKIRPWQPEFGPEGRHFVSRNSLFLYFWESSETAMGGGSAQRSVGRVNEPNKTGARSARACTRGQNPLVKIEYWLLVLFHDEATSKLCRNFYDFNCCIIVAAK